MTLREQPTESARLENHLMIVNALDNGSDMRDGNANDVASAYTEWAIKNAVRATLDTIDDWSLPNQWALTDPRMAEEVTKGVQTSWLTLPQPPSEAAASRNVDSENVDSE